MFEVTRFSGRVQHNRPGALQNDPPHEMRAHFRHADMCKCLFEVSVTAAGLHAHGYVAGCVFHRRRCEILETSVLRVLSQRRAVHPASRSLLLQEAVTWPHSQAGNGFGKFRESPHVDHDASAL